MRFKALKSIVQQNLIQIYRICFGRVFEAYRAIYPNNTKKIQGG